jgi:hypothetical protein
MPNGHNATPRFYHPALILAACGLAGWFYADRQGLWWAVAAVAAAAGFEWCLSFNWVMWHAMEYGGAVFAAEADGGTWSRRKHQRSREY